MAHGKGIPQGNDYPFGACLVEEENNNNNGIASAGAKGNFQKGHEQGSQIVLPIPVWDGGGDFQCDGIFEAGCIQVSFQCSQGISNFAQYSTIIVVVVIVNINQSHHCDLLVVLVTSRLKLGKHELEKTGGRDPGR